MKSNLIFTHLDDTLDLHTFCRYYQFLKWLKVKYSKYFTMYAPYFKFDTVEGSINIYDENIPKKEQKVIQKIIEEFEMMFFD